ncbi:MAG: cupin domain-containing protein, partial [Chloroflexi bacterium]|nr:cupin domain-containing protein [Chloroflexota bacterium]
SPHYHVNCESAIYVVKGTGRFLTGKNLENSLPIGPGDFIHVPADAVHQPVNDSLTEPLELIVARNTPVEIVVEYDPKK